MLRHLILVAFSFLSLLCKSQNATFISPYRDSTVFIFSVIDSNHTQLGEVSYHLHKIKKSSKGYITQLSKDSTGAIMDSSTFIIEKDSTGFNISSDFFLTPKQRIGLFEMNQEKNQRMIHYPSKFSIDTLKNINLEYNFTLDGQNLGKQSVTLTERYIEKGEFKETPLGRKYCYKVTTKRTANLLFKKTETRIVDWYSNEGLVRREFYVDGLLEKEYRLKRVR